MSLAIEIRKPTAAEIESARAWAVWTCPVSSFEWGYGQTETCLMVSGKVKIEAQGREWHFGPGDWVVFPKGLACRWHVLEPVVKHYRFED